jgi:hypothetical protein
MKKLHTNITSYTSIAAVIVFISVLPLFSHYGLATDLVHNVVTKISTNAIPFKEKIHDGEIKNCPAQAPCESLALCQTGEVPLAGGFQINFPVTISRNEFHLGPNSSGFFVPDGWDIVIFNNDNFPHTLGSEVVCASTR